MQVNELMKHEVYVIPSHATVLEAAKTMRTHNIGFLPVGRDDVLVGTISDRDLSLGVLAEGKNPNNAVVIDHMTDGIVYCYDDDSIKKAAELMAGHQIRRLPVVSREKVLVGILSLSDIVRAESAQSEAALALKGICRQEAS